MHAPPAFRGPDQTDGTALPDPTLTILDPITEIDKIDRHTTQGQVDSLPKRPKAL
jgi:hypothetical protein